MHSQVGSALECDACNNNYETIHDNERKRGRKERYAPR